MVKITYNKAKYKKISEILLKYETDKNKCTHTYGSVYDRIFNNFNITDKLNILEIGVFKGGSLLAWKDYFYNSKIYGVDIKDFILPEYRRNDFTYIISDIKSCYTKEKIKNINFDIIIDDGSHLLEDILYVVSEYSNKLTEKGFLIIEDCQRPEEYVSEISKILNKNFILNYVDLRSDNGRYDNFICIIQRKAEVKIKCNLGRIVKHKR